MSQKTYTTALVLIPPVEIWEPIQSIRRVHDRHLRRWMPHVTLLYPFREREEFVGLAEQFSAVCSTIEPFRIDLVEMRFFEHRSKSYTLWLAPEPRNPLVQLQARLGRIVPDCDDVMRHRDGFTPHLSVAQVRGARQMVTLKAELQKSWRPIAFTASEIHLIWRREPPDDVFRIDQRVLLSTEKPQQGHQQGGSRQRR